MKAHEVAEAFVNGKVGSASNLMTTGREVFSYQMKIAEALPNGKFRVIADSESPSVTTIKHIRCVRAAIPSRLLVEVESFEG